MKNDVSMIDEAYTILVASKKVLSFKELVDQVSKDLEMTPEESTARLGEFYTELSVDGRFVALTDNTWDLRARHTYAKVHIDVKDVYSDVEESDDDAESVEENKKYDAEVEGKEISDDNGEEEAGDEADPDKKITESDIAGLGIKKGEDY